MERLVGLKNFSENIPALLEINHTILESLLLEFHGEFLHHSSCQSINYWMIYEMNEFCGGCFPMIAYYLWR